MRFSIIILIGSFLAANVVIASDRIEIPPLNPSHPRLLLKQNDLSLIKQRVMKKEEPWFNTWKNLEQHLQQQIKTNRKAGPYVGPNSFKFFEACTKDSGYARDLAMAYWISGDEIYSVKSLEMLTGWAQNEPLPSSTFDPEVEYPNTGMEVARSALPFIWTYDLLYNYPKFTSEQKKAVEKWFRLLLTHIETGAKRWKDNDFFDKQYYQNHIAADAMGTLAIAYALGDEKLIRYALDSNENPRDVLDVIEGCILMKNQKPYYREPAQFKVHDGEIIDRYRHFKIGGQYKGYVTKPNRGLQYCGLTLLLMTTSAEIAYQNGVDVFSYIAPTGENLELCFDFYADFYRLKDDNLKDGFYIGEKERIGEGGDDPSVYELGFKHYPANKSIQMLLCSMDRTRHEIWILGRPGLYFGQPINCK
ncbi:MAG: hypothetical protein A2Y10_19930 [Planctomycetes bacterium GWF2_41_51]|nr:MAG: hypothetical protein A2Y10_19930 [Planctomycetes bacterium GWF2_41_51]HBG28555.1 hypothetical protein [Phycisphaerales bacterium]